MARPRIDLEMIGIPVGATVTLRGRDDVACVVVGLNPPQIVYEGEVVSLARAAQRAYGKERIGTTVEQWLVARRPQAALRGVSLQPRVGGTG